MGGIRYRLVLWGSLCVFYSWICAAVSAAPVVWDFQSAATDWQPRGKTVRVERVVTVGPNGKQMPSLRIHGPIAEGWNYAQSNTVPMAAGKLYRLSAWVRVDRVGAGTPMPYLKCEFQTADRKRDLGRANTEVYDASQLGKWQQLRGEFQAPAGTQSCWLALEKGTNSPAEIDACLADVRLEQIERLSYWDTYRLKPIPPALEKMRGVHPRIYLTSERIEELRAAIKTTHAAIWKKIRIRRTGLCGKALRLMCCMTVKAGTNNFGNARWEMPCRCWRWPTY